MVNPKKLMKDVSRIGDSVLSQRTSPQYAAAALNYYMDRKGLDLKGLSFAGHSLYAVVENGYVHVASSHTPLEYSLLSQLQTSVGTQKKLEGLVA